MTAPTHVSEMVDGLRFDFAGDWLTAKCDDWAFYRKQFCRLHDGLKSVDLLALSPRVTGDPAEPTLWLIEVKDYRRHERTKTISLHEEMAGKVSGTLALLLPAKLSATVPDEMKVAGRALNAKRIRVVLHIEQPKVVLSFTSKTSAINLANVQLELRKRVKAIDAHPEVLDSSSSRVPWTVTP